MTVKGQIKEGTGYALEEGAELVGNKKGEAKGREIRNEGRIEDGKAPKTTPTGSGN